MNPRHLAAAVGAIVLAPLLAGAPATAAPGSAATTDAASARAAAKPKVALKASVDAVQTDQTFRLIARKPAKVLRSLTKKQKRRLKLVVERRDTRWVKVGVAKGGAKKARIKTTAPTNSAGSLRYRATLKLGKRKLAVGRVAVPVIKPTVPPPAPGTLTATLASTSATDPIVWSVTITPPQATRPVRIEEYVDGSWKQLGQPGAFDANGAATLNNPALGYPTWLRVNAPEWQGHPALVSPPVQTKTSANPKVIAHRAGAGVAPEQTVSAALIAVSSGAKSMEIDVQLTSDDKPIIVHDGDFKATTNVEDVFPARQNDPVGSFTLAEVKQLDAGGWYDPKFIGEEIPTLDEMIDALGATTELVLEVKSPEVAGNDQIDEVLGVELASGKLGDLADAGRLTVSSFNHTWLKAFDTSNAGIPVAALTTLDATTAQLDDWAQWADEVHANVFLATKATVDAAHARGLEVSVWTPNTASGMRTALALGADGIITDHIALLPQVLSPAAPTS